MHRPARTADHPTRPAPDVAAARYRSTRAVRARFPAALASVTVKAPPATAPRCIATARPVRCSAPMCGRRRRRRRRCRNLFLAPALMVLVRPRYPARARTRHRTRRARCGRPRPLCLRVARSPHPLPRKMLARRRRGSRRRRRPCWRRPRPPRRCSPRSRFRANSTRAPAASE